MSNNMLSITVSTEYQDVSFLLYILTKGSTQNTSFYLLALQAFGLSYSSQRRQADAFLDNLQTKIQSVDTHSQIIAEEVEAISLASHVILQRKGWDRGLKAHQETLHSYFARVADADWLRSTSIATCFILGFAECPSFERLTSQAGDYLEKKLQSISSRDFPLILFGLWMIGRTPQIDQTQIKEWLDRTHQPFKSLCMLAIALDALNHPLSKSAISRLRARILAIYFSAIAPNIATARILLAVVHMAEMGQDAEQITSALKNMPVEDEMRELISAVIRADSRLFIEFDDKSLTKPPVIEFLAFYLYAASLTGIDQAYLVTKSLKTQFTEWLKMYGNSNFRAIQQTPLTLLILLVLSGCVYILHELWWPLSNRIYEGTMSLLGESPLFESYLDDFLKWLVAIPVYCVVGFLAALWLYGKARLIDLRPGEVTKNIKVIFQQTLRKLV
jgi:hypothetical protein